MNASLRVSSCVFCGTYMRTWVSHIRISMCIYLCMCVCNGCTALCMMACVLPMHLRFY